jgi:glycosidase
MREAMVNKWVGIIAVFLISSLTLGPRPVLSAPLVPGIQFISNSEVIFCLDAPGKKKVNLVGDFNQWKPGPENQMIQAGDQFWISLKDLMPGKEYIYQYLIDDEIKVGDPYATKIVDFNFDKEIISAGIYPGLIHYDREFDGLAAVFTAGLPHPRKNAVVFVKPEPENLLIYEVLVRDFVKSHTFKEMRDSLAYFKRLGVNTIELMPVMEFENNFGWGYSSTYFFAVDKYYGPAEDLYQLIQSAHEIGLAVIMDIVLNHAMGQSPLVRMYWDKVTGKPSSDSPYANQSPHHPFSVGFDLNYESAYTMKYFKRVLQYWLEEYHMDGFRIDLSKGLTQKDTFGDVAAWGRMDPSRVRILNDLALAAREADPKALLILEHFGDNDEEKLLSSMGFLLWGNSTFDHGFAAEGRVSQDFDWAYFKNRTWGESHLVSYMESHDEERLMARMMKNGLSSGAYDVKSFSIALERSKLTTLFLLGIPGPKMLWQYGEWGDNRELGVTPEARMGSKPLPDDYPKDQNRIRLWNVYSSLLHFRQKYQVAFKEGQFSWKPDGSIRSWKLSHSSLNAMAVGNFGVTEEKLALGITGIWYDYFTRQKITLSGSNEVFLRPGEFHLLIQNEEFANLKNLTDFPLPSALHPEDVVAGILKPQPITRRFPIFEKARQHHNLIGQKIRHIKKV